MFVNVAPELKISSISIYDFVAKYFHLRLSDLQIGQTIFRPFGKTKMHRMFTKLHFLDQLDFVRLHNEDFKENTHTQILLFNKKPDWQYRLSN